MLMLQKKGGATDFALVKTILTPFAFFLNSTILSTQQSSCIMGVLCSDPVHINMRIISFVQPSNDAQRRGKKCKSQT
jgi:hypothetical protein